MENLILLLDSEKHVSKLNLLQIKVFYNSHKHYVVAKESYDIEEKGRTSRWAQLIPKPKPGIPIDSIIKGMTGIQEYEK